MAERHRLRRLDLPRRRQPTSSESGRLRQRWKRSQEKLKGSLQKLLRSAQNRRSVKETMPQSRVRMMNRECGDVTFVGLFIEPHSNVAWQPCAQTAVAESFATPDKNVRLADEWAIVLRFVFLSGLWGVGRGGHVV